MKKSTAEHVIRVLRIAALVALALILLPPLVDIAQSKRARVRLLCKTDHQALREAGRDVLGLVSKGSLKTGSYDVRARPRLPDGSSIPQAILNLGARTMHVSDDGYLMIEMHGAMDHFGVCIYPADFHEPLSPFKYGDRQLIEGLWYYDEEYHLNPNYDKVVERILARRHDQPPD